MQEENKSAEQEAESFSKKDWLETPPAMLDLRAVYEAELEPLVNQLADLARKHGIPLLVFADTGCVDGGDGIGRHHALLATLSPFERSSAKLFGATLMLDDSADPLSAAAICAVAESARARPLSKPSVVH